MGLYDRDYTQADFHTGPSHRFMPHMGFHFPRLTPVVKKLIIINVAIYIPMVLFPRLGVLIIDWFSVNTTSAFRYLQIWSLVSYQFLHSPIDIFHIILNMLCLFFLGPALESNWGSKKFLSFYLICGIAGGLFYMLLTAVNILPGGTLIGASGAVLGVLVACAILFPRFIIFLLIFPVPIRIGAVVITLIYLYQFLNGQNAGGNACHFAGMAAAVVYVFSEPWRSKQAIKFNSGRWAKKVAEERDLQAEVDRILEKVHKSGIHSLTFKEKRTLKQATKAEQMKNRL